MMVTENIIDHYFQRWTAGKTLWEAIISIFYNIRDIPYGVVPELNNPISYLRILELNMGSCTPKHLLLCEMYRRLGLDVLYSVHPYSWAQDEERYPPNLWKLAERMPIARHLACKVDIDGRYVLVDATIDLPLARIGLITNDSWDGRSDTLLPVLPIGSEELYFPDEAALMPPPEIDDNALAFYNGLNKFFQDVRDGKY